MVQHTASPSITVAPGRPGVLVWSPIDWHGTEILRDRSGDLIEGGTKWDGCPGCGLVVPRLFGPFRRLEHDFIKVRGARVDLAELRAAIETALPRDSYQIEILAGAHGRHAVNAYLEDRPGLNAAALHEIVMTAVELRIDRLTLEDHADMQTRLHGGGGWTPRWLINA